MYSSFDELNSKMIPLRTIISASNPLMDQVDELNQSIFEKQKPSEEFLIIDFSRRLNIRRALHNQL